MKDNAELIIIIGQYMIKPEHYRAEIEYMLLPEYYGKGIVSEAIKEVFKYGFEVINYILSRRSLTLKIMDLQRF